MPLKNINEMKSILGIKPLLVIICTLYISRYTLIDFKVKLNLISRVWHEAIGK